MKDFLLELHTEELPPKLLPTMMQSLADNFSQALTQHQLNFSAIKPFGTPRRIAILVLDLAEKQPDKTINKKGPNINANEKAIAGFAHSNGISIDLLVIENTNKGKYYYFKDSKKGQKTSELLAEISQNAIKNIPIVRPMRWGNNEFSFIRPIHSLILLFGNKVITTTIMNLKSNNTTTGLRFNPNNKIKIDEAKNYQNIMLDIGKIEVDFAIRKKNIINQITNLSNLAGLTVIENPLLLSEVCALIEYPKAFIGKFEKKFLDLPKEVIIISMAQHQKYFAVVDKNNNLTNKFIAVSNIESKDINVIIKGNEKVVKPRLEDAEFFWNTDKKTTLESKLEKLKTVTFMQALGTMFERVQRIKKISVFCSNYTDANPVFAARAAILAKADLTSNMVGEFASLQGIIGQYYAEFDGEDLEVSLSISEHYKPRFADDSLPTNAIGISVAIADKIDTICGIFSINQAPTGSKDPYALRRLALGLMRIFIEKQINIDLKKLIKFSLNSYYKNEEKLANQILEFMYERLRSYYKNQNIQTTSLLAASKSKNNINNPFDLHLRVLAIDEFSKNNDSKDLIEINKRIVNILKNADYSENNNLTHEVEKKLKTKIDLLSSTKNYSALMKNLLSLKPELDNFFDKLIINDKDKNIKNARFTLLKIVADKFAVIGDLTI